eukprot:CAMPEP_0194509430 /NCGR_PEP_ID=MMETSP0253-20130528/40199_1 /TAXON_ID=2966 /ORGANISM="Noctiluca scintillans" /LENGTH=280 /DNA_ID=CAMNT_0039352583 /DNA_START=50 /DNA_END=889 /DNA_ORIENTATION=-
MSSGPSPAPPGNLPSRSSAEPQRRGGRRGRRGGADRERPPQDTERSTLRTQMQKTKMCEFFLNGKCKYGADCAFAHHESEIRNAPDLKKTRLCHAFSKGRCDDSDCNFAHGQEELRTTDFCFKKTLCMWHSKGTCANGERCRFAHGKPDLRSGGEDEPSEPRRPGGQRKRKRAPGRSATQPRVRNKAKRKDGIARSGFAMRALKLAQDAAEIQVRRQMLVDLIDRRCSVTVVSPRWPRTLAWSLVLFVSIQGLCQIREARCSWMKCEGFCVVSLSRQEEG